MGGKKVALVTGGAKRVGRAIALALADRGYHVAVHFLSSRKEATGTVSAITRKRKQAQVFQADLTSVSDIQLLIRNVLKKFGQLDVLVNNAAVFHKTPFHTISEKEWDFFMSTNLKSVFFCSKMAAEHMLKRKGGKIINIADWSGLRPYKSYIPYCVSKAGVIALTKALAVTLAPKIQVNAVAPGPVLLPEDFSKKEKQAIIQKTPLRRIGTPEAVAKAVCFLAEDASFTTGSVIFVDGGRLIA